MKKLTATWFADVFENGCPNFDGPLLQALPIALMVAVNCRVGDFTLNSDEHKKAGQYMKLEDIVLTLHGDDLNAANVKAFITIKY